MNAGALCETRSITVRRVVGEKYSQIIGHDLGPKPEWREPGEDLDELPAEARYAYAGEGGVPF